MKHYIILTGAICNMGGAEMFTSNKVKYLKKHDWDVRVFFFNDGAEIKIPNLSEYKDNYIPEMKYGYYYYSEKQRNRVIDHICLGIKKGDALYIESHLMNLTYWAEMIAHRYEGVSILNAMEESIVLGSAKDAEFVKFKIRRMEVLNASDKSFKRYLKDYYTPDLNNYTHSYMFAYCSNVVCDEDPILELPSEGANILSIGRLDKPYVLPMFEEIKLFARSNPGNLYNVLVIGGSPDNSVETKVKEMFRDVNNVRIFLYGYMFPVPRNLVQHADVGIASANSVLVSADQGIPTIAICIYDYLPLGIYGRTTNSKFGRDNEPVQSVSQLLKEVLIDKLFDKTFPIEFDEDAELENVFGKQIVFLDLCSKRKEYYDVMSIHSPYERLKCRLLKKYHILRGNWITKLI